MNDDYNNNENNNTMNGQGRDIADRKAMVIFTVQFKDCLAGPNPRFDQSCFKQLGPETDKMKRHVRSSATGYRPKISSSQSSNTFLFQGINCPRPCPTRPCYYWI